MVVWSDTLHNASGRISIRGPKGSAKSQANHECTWFPFYFFNPSK